MEQEQNHKMVMEQAEEDNVKGTWAVLGAAAAEEEDEAGEGHEGVIVEVAVAVAVAAAVGQDDKGTVA